MKLEQFETDVLKNFTVINQSILFREGNIVKTMSPNKTLEARAVFETSFDREFAIYDLKNFLSVLSLFDDPDIELEEDYAIIKENNRSVVYNYADPDTIMAAPKEDFDVNEVALKFRLTEEQTREIARAGGVLRSPEICIEVADGTLKVKTLDSENDSYNEYNIDIEEFENDGDLKIFMRMEYYKLLEMPYEVTVYRDGDVVRFQNRKVEYWIPVEDNSTL